jgi:hypothetical protein
MFRIMECPRTTPAAADSKLDLPGFSIKLGLEPTSAPIGGHEKSHRAATPLPSGKE